MQKKNLYMIVCFVVVVLLLLLTVSVNLGFSEQREKGGQRLVFSNSAEIVGPCSLMEDRVPVPR